MPQEACAAEQAPSPSPAAAEGDGPRLYIGEYRVRGTDALRGGGAGRAPALGALEVEEAVYPFLGPHRTMADAAAAAAALEKAYRDKGFQTVAVTVPAQSGAGGVVFLDAALNPVGRLRVKGARFFSPSKIAAAAPSMAEGTVVDFNKVARDIGALNRWADRRVTPELRPGVEPGTVDIDLRVEDSPPLHGSLEVNNRFSPDTTELRVNGSISYGNLWQRGDAAGFSFQTAPERTEDALVYSAYYLARLREIDWLSLLLQGTKQDSDISTLGGAAVAGRGEILGVRAVLALPSKGTGFYQSANFGIDYKHFTENVVFGGTGMDTPITYWPLSLSYGATWTGKGRVTELNAGVNFHVRGSGSDAAEFDAKRYNADGSFFYVRGDLAHTRDLPGGLEGYVKVQGQAAGGPLLNSEQYAGGGLGNARGYLESTALGDNAVFGTLELRSPLLTGTKGKPDREWRVYGFLEGGALSLHDALPGQEDAFEFLSAGAGSRARLFKHLHGSVDAGVPLISQPQAERGDVRVTFRLWTDF